jgi:shikimate dehydrogenase
MDDYYLIGENLEHSFSAIIHNKFGLYDYKLKNISKNEFKDFVLSKSFKGLNITIPYKSEIINYLDETDEIVKKTSSCNVVVIVNDVLKGYNTDYYGFSYMLDYHNFSIHNSKVLILGTGATSRTVQELLRYDNEIFLLSRNKQKGTYSYDDISELLTVDYIINTTPVGMYPNNYQKLFSLDKFLNLKGVIDVVFNPFNTQLLIEAKKKNIKCCNGLIMLIEQARLTSELFLNKPLKIDLNDIYSALVFQKKNIALIGMPMAGKTKTGLKLAGLIGREFVDLDAYIEIKEKRTIKEIFSYNGEAYFRAIESKYLKSLMKMSGLVVALGGGIVERSENYNIIHENGFIVNIYRDTEKLIYNKKRPLVHNVDDYVQLFNKRKGIYESFADVTFLNNGSVTTLAKKIWEAFCENISN